MLRRLDIPTSHRILDPRLGGGAILDLGPYPLFWAVHLLFDDPANASAHPEAISGTFVKNARTGVDQNTSFALDFPRIPAQALLSCSINVPAREVGVFVRFRKGTIVIDPPIYCPRAYKVVRFEKEGSDADKKEERVEFKWEGRGMHFEADEVGRCVRDGKLASTVWTHDKTTLEMKIFDEVGGCLASTTIVDTSCRCASRAGTNSRTEWRRSFESAEGACVIVSKRTREYPRDL
jgi:predicted dehydrogenase